MEKSLRVGVVGLGVMGKNHARLYSELPNVKLVGLCDTEEGLVENTAKQYRVRAFTNYIELLKQNLDAISIAVPTTLHKKVALDTIEKGISVLIEKPITDTVENADEIIQAAKQKGVKLMIGHIERFNPAIMKLKELINNRQLGDIISISARRVGPYVPRIRDVGIILDLGTHDIDIMSYLYGERVKEVYSSAGAVIHNHEDHAIITLNFNNGGSGVIETNWLTPHKMRNLTVIGLKGIAEVDYIESTLRIFDREWVKDAKIDKEEPLKLELLHFINCVRHDKEPLISGEDGKHALEVALAAIDSYQTEKVISIK